MSNLLPVVEKKKIHKEYHMRLGVVAVFLFAVLLTISIILLSPSFILSSFKYDSAIKQLETEKKKISDAVEGVDPIKVAKEVNIQLGVLGQEGYLMPLSYDVFTIIVGHKPDSVKIKSMFYDRKHKDGSISIGGVSKDRKTLLSFLQFLESEEMFTSVELPISSFVEGEDINFSIRITLNKEDEGVSEENKENKENKENEE